jgi:predicted esterase
MSGFIPTVEGWEPKLDSRAGLPVFISHGAHDPVISVEFARDARRRLQEAALDVDYHEHEGGHHLDSRHLPLTEWVAARRAALRARPGWRRAPRAPSAP